MAKFAVLLVAAFAFHATLGGAIDTHANVRDLQRKLSASCEEAIGWIQGLHIQDAEDKRAIVSHSNEFAYKIENTVYHLIKTIVHIDDGTGRQVLQDAVSVLSDVAHEVQQGIVVQRLHLKNALLSNIKKLELVGQRLSEVVQHHTKEDHEKYNRDIEHVLDDLLNAVHQLQARGHVDHQSHEEAHGNLYAATNQLYKTLERVNVYDDETAHYLVHQAHELAHFLGHIVYHFQRQIQHHAGEDGNAIQQFARKFTEIRSALERTIISNQHSNIHHWIDELKEELRNTVKQMTSEVEHLVQYAKHQRTNDRDFEYLVRDVVADTLNAERRFQRQLENILNRRHYH